MLQKKRKKTARGAFRVTAAKGLLKLLAALPLPVARAVGASAGWLGWRLGGDHARITRINLSACFPGLSDEQREKLGRRSLIESGKTAAEMGALFRWSHARCLNLIERVENEALLDDAIAQNKGVVVLLPHLGNWEAMGPFLAAKGRFVALYQPPEEEGLEKLLIKARERTGMTAVPTTQRGIVRLFKELEKGAITAILPDQQPGRKAGGVFAPFFGIEALTGTLLPKILQKTGASVVCGVALRTPKGFELRFLEADRALYDPDETVSATALSREVERCVRLAPEQYVWEYKRFRRRPEGQPKFY